MRGKVAKMIKRHAKEMSHRLILGEDEMIQAMRADWKGNSHRDKGLIAKSVRKA